MAGAEFVDGWFVAQVLGEGAYGEVRLLQHASGARVALKALGAGDGAGAREAALHGALRHPHIVRCLGHRVHADTHYLFLEWAAGGELFEQIEPDAGMCEARARRLYRQLLGALRYLHARGVAHRDVKPENLLLASDGRLLLADFGLATVFRAAGRERRLARVCGTPPYAAPEVLLAPQRPYRAPPADLWSAAVVLLAMLVGELPWARAAEEDPAYAAWSASSGPPRAGPWRRVPPAALALLRAALRPDPAARASLEQLLDHPWTRQHDSTPEESVSEEAWVSQGAAECVDAARAAALWHSQPCGQAGGPRAPPPRAALWLRCDAGAAGAALRAAAAARGWRRRGDVLAAAGAALRVSLAAAGALTLLQLRRAGGCGLDYKRRVNELRADLAPLLSPAPPPDPAE